jgi:chromosomal replication initiator protein
MAELWAQAVLEIKERIGKQNYETWIRPIIFVSRNKNEIFLNVPNKFFRDWLIEHYLAQIENIVSSLAKHETKVIFEINEKLDGQPNFEKTVKKDDKEREKSQRNNLVPKYTFQNFVVGASNQFAHAACMAVANQPGDHYNPLFLYGGVGLGKTHLVNAIGHQAAAQRPGLKIGYLSSETSTFSSLTTFSLSPARSEPKRSSFTLSIRSTNHTSKLSSPRTSFLKRSPALRTACAIDSSGD